MPNHQFSRRDFLRLTGGVVGLGVLGLGSYTGGRAAVSWLGTELLTRPTATSVTVTVVPNSAIRLYYQYSVTSGGPWSATSETTAPAGTPTSVVISGLTPNTRYYYRMAFSEDGGSTWSNRPENSFYTARAAGSEFSFTITSDSHVNIV
ncbi:MAG: fibronectin type III domain-containing protein, partial [Anaerolineaceae bacterium]|nr:fibronectin type III domain-containing protein [Anaerolineaceae bacterium]